MNIGYTGLDDAIGVGIRLCPGVMALTNDQQVDENTNAVYWKSAEPHGTRDDSR
jgi:hypothetical protein